MTRLVARWAAVVVSAVLLVLGTGAAAAGADQADPPAPIRGAMLLLDTSGSMTQADITAARDAALEYSRSIPTDVHVGLIRFADQAELVVAPTTNRADLAAGLTEMTAGGDTSLYDAIRLGVSALDDLDGVVERRLVVLSDGVDTSSATSLASARNALTKANVVADFVAFRYGTGDTSGMKSLANANRGTVLTAEDAAQLSDAFAAIARSAPPTRAGDDRPAWLSWAPAWSWQVAAVAGLTFTSVLLLAALLFTGFRRREDSGTRAVDHIARYGAAHVPDGERRESSFARTAVGWTEDVLRSRGWEEALAERLDLAAISMKPAEWTVLRICLAVVTSAVMILLGVHFVVGVILGGLLTWLGTWAFVHFRISRRRAAFADQLPDVLQLVAGSLTTGFSLAQALDAVVRENTQPAAGEFARALAETRIGVELEPALERVAQRMASADLTWIVMAIRIQREVGGNLAEVLLTTVTTMRERAQTRRQVRALSAEGRLSAYVLLALPIGVGGFVFWSNPDYMRPLYTTAIGVVMLVVSVLLMALGSFWMSRLVKVEV